MGLLLWISLSCGLVALYIFLRNPLVYKFRLDILNRDSTTCRERIKSGQFKEGDSFHPTFQALPSYCAMMWKFWIWPLSRFLPKTDEEED